VVPVAIVIVGMMEKFLFQAAKFESCASWQGRPNADWRSSPSTPLPVVNNAVR
jgi:hypothetical protein